jgi:hypothetical protein
MDANAYMQELLRSPKKGDAVVPDPTVLERFRVRPPMRSRWAIEWLLKF